MQRFIVVHMQTRQRLGVLDAPNEDRALTTARVMFGRHAMVYADRS